MSLTAAILWLATVWVGTGGPVYSRALRRHEIGAVGRAAELARYTEQAAAAANVRAPLLIALVYLESSFRSHAVHPATGAFGLGALHPRSRWASGLAADCAAHPEACEGLSVLWSARALREGVEACGSEVRAVGWYRSGRCVAGPRARHAVRLARRVERFSNKQGRLLALQPRSVTGLPETGAVWAGLRN